MNLANPGHTPALEPTLIHKPFSAQANSGGLTNGVRQDDGRESRQKTNGVRQDDGRESRRKRVAFATFGCRLNKAEALDSEASYAAAGWEIVSLKPSGRKEKGHTIEDAPSHDGHNSKENALNDVDVSSHYRRDAKEYALVDATSHDKRNAKKNVLGDVDVSSCNNDSQTSRQTDNGEYFVRCGASRNTDESNATASTPNTGPHATHSQPHPDLIIVRGCSVTAKAQRDCEKFIAHLRLQFPRALVKVTGCLKPEKQATERLLGSIPDAPIQAAPQQGFSDHASPVRQTEKISSAICASTPDIIPSANHYALSRAYLKVQDGCSGRCSYCIVPSFRGKPTSIPFYTVLEHARAFLAAGFREIILAGCNLCLYKSEGRGIAELATALAALESPGHRIRFGSIEPGVCDNSILDAMAGSANICRFLHLSLQSGSDRILKLMRRPYSSEQVLSFCAEACRRLGPRLALGADIIAGFPGESDSDHEATKRFVSMNLLAADAFRAPAQGTTLSPFIHLHVFPYSERPGTEAATLAGSIPTEVRRRRAKEIEAIGLRNRLGFASALVGKTVAVCVELGGSGRTDEHLRCILHGNAERKSIVRATVENYSLKDGSLSAIISAKDE